MKYRECHIIYQRKVSYQNYSCKGLVRLAFLILTYLVSLLRTHAPHPEPIGDIDFRTTLLPSWIPFHHTTPNYFITNPRTGNEYRLSYACKDYWDAWRDCVNNGSMLATVRSRDDLRFMEYMVNRLETWYIRNCSTEGQVFVYLHFNNRKAIDIWNTGRTDFEQAVDNAPLPLDWNCPGLLSWSPPLIRLQDCYDRGAYICERFREEKK